MEERRLVVRCCHARERPEVRQAHQGHWAHAVLEGWYYTVPSLEKMLLSPSCRGLALFTCRIGSKDQSGDFYLRNIFI